MNAERWSVVDDLFGEALDLPREERGAFLDRACGGDGALRETVERLIAADESARSTFLEHLPILEGGEETVEGARFGPYRIERLLSRGGMGTVYLATRDDGQFERRVALKLLHPGARDPEALQRFRAERQVLARLEHPSIARLYDGGETEDGVPFLVMEYVEGLPLDVYCDRNRLGIDGRLRLFRRLLDAVAYAHQNLLVHRDIKPANILVVASSAAGAAGEPKLLDFGIAKQLAHDAAGEPWLTLMRVMTPGYASPEQVRGEAITTASDVYSLGVVLYELLCGHSPYRLESGLPHELESAILTREPERPSHALDRGASLEEVCTARRTRPRELRRTLRGDLDTIVLTALRKEPQRRYRSVVELAADVDRYLREEPVSARPDTAFYRAGKFVRRNRLGVALAGAALGLIAVLCVSLFQQRNRAESERDKARGALAFLVDVFEHADPYQKGAENVSARELLETGARRASRELAGDPEAQASLLDALGQASVGLGQVEQAAPLLEKALDLRRRLPVSPELAVSLEHVAWERFLRSDYDRSEPLVREAVDLRRRLSGDDSPQLAASLNLLGSVMSERYQSGGEARLNEIERLLLEALGIYRRVPDEAGVAKTLFQLAKVKLARGDLPGAERLYRQVLPIQRRLYGEDHPELAQYLRALALTLISQGKPEEPKALLREALASQRKVLPKGHPDLAATLNDLALAYTRSADYAAAEPLYREALSASLATHGESHADTATFLYNLAGSLQNQGKLEEAAELHQRALAVRRSVYGERHLYVAQVLGSLARLRSDQGHNAEALDLARQAVEIDRGLLEPGHPELIWPLRAMGIALLGAGRPAEAEPYLRESLDILRKTQAPGYFQTARVEVLLGTCLARLGGPGRDGEARRLLAQGLATLEARFPPGHPWVKDAREKLDLVNVESR